MIIRKNKFKSGIQNRTSQIGFWCSLASNVSIEILAGSGFDWLLIDTEHSPNEIPMVYSQLQAMMENDTQPVVRPPWNDMVMIKRYLDAGAQNLLIPCVQTKEDAENAVAFTRYPPNGVRGFAMTSRSSRFGRIPNYHSECEAEICVLVQIETRKGLDNLEEIANVEGVDGVFVGPGDLSADLGFLGSPGHPEVETVIMDALARIRACGKPSGILTGDLAQAKRFIEAGCVFTAVGSDAGLLARGSEQIRKNFKDS